MPNSNDAFGRFRRYLRFARKEVAPISKLISPSPLILHVVESYGGGVASAIDAYVASTPGLRHHLLAAVRVADFASSGELTRFGRFRELPTHLFAAMKSIRSEVKQTRPDVVHVHSSLAGAFARLSIRSSRTRIVYTPHCYAFERRDLHVLVRAAYWLIEWFLGANTSATAACSKRELALSRLLMGRGTSVLVPNVGPAADSALLRPSGITEGGQSHLLVAVGRLTAQKDPLFFREVVDIVRQTVPCEALWLGDGEPDLRTALVGDSIDVSGWLPRTEIVNRLCRAGIYVHTAAWEGFPVSILEASVLGLPIAARSIPALGEHAGLGGPDAESLAQTVIKLLSANSARSENIATWRNELAINSELNQRDGLALAYGLEIQSRRPQPLTPHPHPNR